MFVLFESGLKFISRIKSIAPFEGLPLQLLGRSNHWENLCLMSQLPALTAFLHLRLHISLQRHLFCLVVTRFVLIFSRAMVSCQSCQLLAPLIFLAAVSLVILLPVCLDVQL